MTAGRKPTAGKAVPTRSATGKSSSAATRKTAGASASVRVATAENGVKKTAAAHKTASSKSAAKGSVRQPDRVRRPPVRRQTTKPAQTRRGRPKSRKKSKVNVPVWLTLCLAAALLAVFIVTPLARQLMRDTDGGEALPPVSFSACGIDISHHNAGPIIWDSLMVMTDRDGGMTRSKVKASKIYPVTFVFIKASEGVSMKDPSFREYWEQAGRSGISRGAYHFFRSSKDGAAQAQNFITATGNLRHSDLPPVLDIETMHLGCSRKLLNERALQWLRIIEEHYGRTPIVYAPDYYVRDVLGREIKEHYPIWVAHYGVDSPITEDWEYWQFTEKASVYGVPGPVDLNFRR